MFKKNLTAFIGIFISLIFIDCSNDKMTGTSGTGNSEPSTISGIILTPAGKPAAGATVQIVTVDHNPGTGLLKRAAVDTLTTNEDGEFTSDSLPDGEYNVLSEQGGNVLYEDSVAVSEDSASDVGEITLGEPGSLSGVIRLQPNHDSRTVFVLVFGTNTFVAPTDSIGNFSLEDMAEGTYSVRILSTLDDYDPLDTTLTITSGADETLEDTLFLPFRGIPVVTGLTLEYDTLKQIVTLSWDAADQDLVKGYNVYRRDSTADFVKINQTLVTDTVYLDSTVFQNGAYEYKIAAVDPGDNEGDNSLGNTIEFANRLRLATNNPAFGERQNHSSVVFNDKIWVIAGNGPNNARSNDVWSSTNGIDWVLEESSVNFPERSHHASVVHDGRIWIIGGYDGDFKNDVWSSSDGITWDQATDSIGFPPRMEHTCIVYDDKMWVIGGNSQSGQLNDVWSSTDGIAWTQATNSASFPKRSGLQALSFYGKMWVIGGDDGFGNKFNDVWSSEDGITWTQTQVSANFSARSNFAIASSTTTDNTIWIIGGFKSEGASTVLSNEIWYSEDGESWGKIIPPTEFNARMGNTSVEFNNKIWIIGQIANTNQSDVWYLE